MDDGGWVHPARLPLGGGWTGHCTAPQHEGALPDEHQLRECCNLGYANACSFRPSDPQYDSVRFGVIRESDDRVVLCYAFEKQHQPGEHGTIEFSRTSGWVHMHPDQRVQKMAECYLDSYLIRKNTGVAGSSQS
jgi:hypothetical protein